MASHHRHHYAWTIAAVIFCTIMIAGGVRSTPGVMINAFENEFGWSRALISGAVSLSILLYGALGPFAAALMDLGMKRCIIVALIAMFIAVACTTVMREAWHLYILWGLVVGAASGFIAPILGKVITNRWFVQHSGIMMGVFSASAQTGQVVLAPLLGFMVQTVGWRGASWLMATVAGAMTIPVAVLLRERPSDMGLLPYGSNPPDGSAITPVVDAASDALPPVPEPGAAAVATTPGTPIRKSAVGSPVPPASPANPPADTHWTNSLADTSSDAISPTAAGRSIVLATDSACTDTDTPLNASAIDQCQIGLTDTCTPIPLPSTHEGGALLQDSAPRLPPPPPPPSPFIAPLLVLRDVSKTADFWLLAGTFFVCGASTNGLIATHLIPACIDSGMRETEAAGFLAGIGVFDIVGTVISGALTDRFDSRTLLALYYAFRGAALVLLPWAFQYQLAGLWPFAALYGLDWIATVPPTAALCTQCFGKERSAIVFAWCLAMHQVGAAAIAALAGVLRTETGSYKWAFWSSGMMCACAAAASLAILRCGNCKRTSCNRTSTCNRRDLSSACETSPGMLTSGRSPQKNAKVEVVHASESTTSSA